MTKFVRCKRAPRWWVCVRNAGHDGPCAAYRWWQYILYVIGVLP